MWLHINKEKTQEKSKVKSQKKVIAYAHHTTANSPQAKDLQTPNLRAHQPA
jgi:hypothetical protein